MATIAFPTGGLLWFGAFAVFYLRIVPALLTHDPSQPWGGLQMRILSDLAAYKRLCDSEARSPVWYYTCAGGWLGGAMMFLVGFSTF